MKKTRGMALVLCLCLCACLSACDKAKVAYLQQKAASAKNNGNFEKAEEFLLEAIHIDPDTCGNYWQLGELYVSMNDKTKAKEVVRKLKKYGCPDMAENLTKMISL